MVFDTNDSRYNSTTPDAKRKRSMTHDYRKRIRKKKKEIRDVKEKHRRENERKEERERQRNGKKAGDRRDRSLSNSQFACGQPLFRHDPSRTFAHIITERGCMRHTVLIPL